MKSLLGLLNGDGEDVARRLVFERQQRNTQDVLRLRSELAATARAVNYVTGESVVEVESRWIKKAEQRAREHSLFTR